MSKSMAPMGMGTKAGGGVTTYTMSGTTKTPNKPAKADCKSAIVQGPFGGKKPA